MANYLNRRDFITFSAMAAAMVGLAGCVGPGAARAPRKPRPIAPGAKIRLAQLDRIPYMLVLGEKEAAAQSVAVRHSKKGDLGVKAIDDFIAEITSEVKERRL